MRPPSFFFLNCRYLLPVARASYPLPVLAALSFFRRPCVDLRNADRVTGSREQGAGNGKRATRCFTACRT